ncbi:MAG: phosphate signaling complex protein PhoU [Cuspidothrix sp.]
MKTVFYASNSEILPIERYIRRLERDLLRMGALVEQSFRLSHQALFNGDLMSAEQIPRLDKKIDRFYRQIESDCTAIIISQRPTEKDLRCLSAFMQLVRDLERIGDYAKDLGEIAIKLFPYPQHSSLPEMAVMSQHAQAMLATCLVALADLDETSGQRMKQLDDAVDNAYEHLYQTFAHQENFSGVIEPILLLTLAIRCLERMADHATNIAQRVTYIVTGQRN